ncbi:MAG: hypothetical protein LBR56_00670 [Sporomusaceae bacterium]|jgi:hypothetical protein|nr:hypothetical protein [Sporomusaceae bacterium]
MEKQVFGPLDLPSGKTIKFREPKGNDRVNVITGLKGNGDNLQTMALLTESYMMAKCITEYDGKESDGDYKRLYGRMSQEDIDYFQEIFHEMFGITPEKKNKAKEAADFLRGKQTCTD